MDSVTGLTNPHGGPGNGESSTGLTPVSPAFCEGGNPVLEGGAQSVAAQADSAREKAIGWSPIGGNEADAFRRSLTTARTPERRNTVEADKATTSIGAVRGISMGDDEVFNSSFSEEKLNENRKRIRSERGKERSLDLVEEVEYLRVVMSDTVKAIRELEDLVQVNSNTKKEIKTTSVKLSVYAERLDSGRVKAVLERAERLKAEGNKAFKRSSSLGNLPSKFSIEAVKKRATAQSVATQTSENDWKRKEYKRTKVAEGSPLTGSSSEADVAVWRHARDPDMTTGIQKMFVDKYGDLAKIEGDIGHIMIETWVMSKEQAERKTKHVLRIDDPREPDGMKRRLEEVRDVLIAHKRNHLAMAWDDGKTIEATRDTLEEVLQSTNLSVTLHIPFGKKNENRVSDGGRDNESIVIRKKDPTVSYASLLKEVKQEVMGKGLQDQVQGVRETKKGELMITLRSKAKGEEMRKALTAKLGKEAVRKKTGREVFFIVRDIDATTTSKDLEEALRSHLDDKNCELASVRVLSLREGAAGNKLATVAVDELGAEAMRSSLYIKVGLPNCRIRERVSVDTCYHCWGAGHTARECKGTDRSKACKNCAQEGHERKDCPNKSRCVECNEEGHPTNTTRCPRFRKLIAEKDPKTQLGQWASVGRGGRSPKKSRGSSSRARGSITKPQ